MKRMMIALLGLALTVPALAQYGAPRYNRKTPPMGHFAMYRPYPEIYFGLRLGAGFSTVSSDNKNLDGGTMRTGIDIGTVVGFQLGIQSPVYLEMGLSYIEKGGKGKVGSSKFSYGLNYLEMPLVAKYRLELAPGFNIQPFAGGYVAVGVSGKIKDYDLHKSYSSFSDDRFKRFDGGIRIGCGLQYDLLYAEMGYDFGLVNISHDDFESSHTGSLFVTLGVNF